jgi:hypothetical protein
MREWHLLWEQGRQNLNLRTSRFDAVFSGTKFRPENTKKAEQSCLSAIAHGATAGRPDQAKLPLMPFETVA